MISESEVFLQFGSRDKPSRSSRPIWNNLSLLLPTLGWWWAYSQYYRPGFSLSNGNMGATGLLLVAYWVALPASIVGLICAIIALVRHERLFVITFIGLLANLTCLAAVLGVTLLIFF